MPDFPRAYNASLGLDDVVSTWDLVSPCAEWLILQGAAPTVVAWPAASRAIYVQIVVEEFFKVRALGCNIGTQSGNLDLGLYDERWNRIVSKGSTAAVAGTMWLDATASVNGTASPTLSPGVYYLAMAVDNTTCTVRATSAIGTAAGFQVHGVQQQAITLPLGATATPANPASAYLPFIAMANKTIL